MITTALGSSYSEHKDPEVGECSRLAKRPTKCHEQGEKWQEMGVRRYLSQIRQDLIGCSKDLGFHC